MGWFNRKKKENLKQAEETTEAEANLPEIDFSEIRKNSLKICEEHGFKPANSLPWIKEVELRPVAEIAGRLHAIKAMVLWLLVPEEDLPSEVIQLFIANNGLMQFMSNDECDIFVGARDDEDWRNAIGWRFENAWPLAWYFGHKELELSGQMMTGEDIQEIFNKYTCSLEETIEDWISEVSPRESEKVYEMEDLFYCLHNAVRSAQMGRDTVPDGFQPMVNGGVIHERRHSLTWMISNGVSWEGTDLST